MLKWIIVVGLVVLVGFLVWNRFYPNNITAYEFYIESKRVMTKERLEVLKVERPKYYWPRGWAMSGDYNPMGWRTIPDPHFTVTPIATGAWMKTRGTSGGTSSVRAQAFGVNRNFEKEEGRETLVAIEFGGEIFEYPVEGYLGAYSPNYPPWLLGTLGEEKLVLLLQKVQKDDVISKGGLALLIVNYPFENGMARLVFESEIEVWQNILRRLTEFEGTSDDICSRKDLFFQRVIVGITGKPCVWGQ